MIYVSTIIILGDDIRLLLLVNELNFNTEGAFLCY